MNSLISTEFFTKSFSLLYTLHKMLIFSKITLYKFSDLSIMNNIKNEGVFFTEKAPLFCVFLSMGMDIKKEEIP